MRVGGGGAIVNLASINSIRGNNRMVAYSASKGGVMAAALDHVADNIRVNCVCPGSIEYMPPGFLAHLLHGAKVDDAGVVD